jgi:AraC-like DNA-binding protein
MPASGSSIFTDADGYQAGLRDILDLLVPRPREFHARLTWLELQDLRLLRAQEASPRIAYVTLPPGLIFVTFPTKPGPPLILGGAELQFGDIMFHSLGEHLHQRTTAASNWGTISLNPASLMTFGRTIAGQDLAPTSVGRILRPSPADRQRLLRLHAQAGRIAETNLALVGNKEVVRALEQDMIWALVTCLTTGKVQADLAFRRRQSRMLVRVEAVLAEHPHQLLSAQHLANAIGVSVRALRTSCLAILGTSLGHYQRLRRLKLVRAELLRCKPAMAGSAEVMERYGFTNLYRFIAEYWNTYGEMPPIPPRTSDQ